MSASNFLLEQLLPGLYGNTLGSNLATIDLSGVTTLLLPAGTSIGGAGSFTGAVTVTSNSANSLAVGPNGATNPVLQIDSSVSSAANGLKIQGTAAGSNVKISVISSGTNENISIDAKGSGQIIMNATGTGGIVTQRATTIANGITAATAGGVKIATLGNAGPQLITGSGVPSLSAVQGSLYLRTDGGASTELYVNRDGATSWKAVTTAA